MLGVSVLMRRACPQPDNLKQLFRSFAMIQPDRRLIGQVMLYSQGFRTAEDLAGKIVLLFELCHDQLSNQVSFARACVRARARVCGVRCAGLALRRKRTGQHEGEREELNRETLRSWNVVCSRTTTLVCARSSRYW